MIKVNARATFSQEGPFKLTTIERRDLQPHDVLIEIKYAGICHSDIHTARGEWGPVNYPLVPGHEIAGIVSQIGSEVTKYSVGDRVGVGCMVDSCGECSNCHKGEEQYCLSGNTGTYGAIDRYGQYTQGGYSTHIVVTEDFVVRIPDSIPLDAAAPLLCAGITTYSPLRHWGAAPGKKVAVVGLGGLGHMAVKIAHAMGAEVTVLSQSLKKKEDGLQLGADHYYATSDPETFKQLAGSFDLIVNTVSAQINIDAYLSLLALDGTLVNVGAPADPLAVNVFSLIGHRRSFAGSMIGGIRETQEMLNFCAEHNIASEIEVISADRIDEAWERVLASDVRYRFVIDINTMGDEYKTFSLLTSYRVHNLKKFDNTGEDMEDLISIGTIGLIKAIESYRPNKGTKLATFAARCIENEILMHLRSLKKTRKDVSLHDPIGTDKEGNEITLIDLDILDDREKEVVVGRFGLDTGGEERTQRGIAKELGISRSYVSRIEKRALMKLYHEFYKAKR